jgi:hypothetical protein
MEQAGVVNPRDRATRLVEHRGDRHGAARDPSIVVHPKGTLMATGHIDTAIALTAAVLDTLRTGPPE